MSTNAHIWLAELDQYFTAARVPDEQRLELAASFLRSGALLAWNGARAAAVDADGRPTFSVRGSTSVPGSSRATSRSLRRRAARMALYNIRQRPHRPVIEYTNAFLRLVVLIPHMDMADQIEHYVRGLYLREVAAEVDRSNPATLTQAMERAQMEEMRLASNNRRFAGVGRAGPGASHSSQSHAPSSSSSHSQSVPMDLSHFDLGDGAEFDDGEASAYDPAPAGESYAAMASQLAPLDAAAASRVERRSTVLVPGLSRED